MTVYVLTGLARSFQRHSLMPMVLDGRIQEAASLAEGMLAAHEAAADGANASELAMLCGDLMLAQDRDTEAEDLYRQAVKAATAAPRGQVRVVSCRNTGFLSLYQQRFGTAAACFRRVADDAAATAAQRVEALCGLALAHHGMGQKTQSLEALDEAAGLAAGGPGETTSGRIAAPLVTMTSLLRAELLVQQEIRAHAALRDHVFWQVPAGIGMAAQRPVEPLALIDACLAAHGGQPLLARRLRYLRALLLAACGDVTVVQSLHDHLAWLRQAGVSTGERQGRVEVALVAIAARQADMARSVLEPLCSRGSDRRRQRWDFELSYCLAKVCELAGRSDESMKHYQRYALESVQCVRTEAVAERSPARSVAPSAPVVKDDVEMSLPAKYRRAYRYLLEHLDCAALSIREIAEHIGVTNRALQSVFRSHLGMTPVEVMRRCRVERIREDLLKADPGGLTVTEAAARWGIRNRSTLVASYRRYFSETPAETLSRRGERTAAGARPQAHPSLAATA
jgi:AraC-like DNA-binding protein